MFNKIQKQRENTIYTGKGVIILPCYDDCSLKPKML